MGLLSSKSVRARSRANPGLYELGQACSWPAGTGDVSSSRPACRHQLSSLLCRGRRGRNLRERSYSWSAELALLPVRLRARIGRDPGSPLQGSEGR